MAIKAYESLFQQVEELLKKYVPGGVTISPKNVITDLSRLESQDYGGIIKSLSDDLSDIIPNRIISGLYTTATNPPSASVIVSKGYGTSQGRKYILAADVTIPIAFDDRVSLYYVVLYGIQVMWTIKPTADQLIIAKIVVPEPGTTSQIVDDKPSDGYDAWIVSARDIVFDEDQEFDDDSVEKLRSVIGEVLADNIIGNIRLSENLKITNTQGTVELDSNSLQIKDFNQNVLAKFNKDGTYFYNPHGVSLAKFTSDEAFIGNILITKNSIQTRNYAAGSTGFQIKDNGNVEFNNGTFRGTLSANLGNIGGWTLDTDSMYATTTGTIKTGINVGAGYNGVILDVDGLRVYDDVLGEVVNLPSDGSAPSFSSGVIEETIFEINTNAVLRTSEYVGSVEADTDLLIHFDGADGATTYTAETGQIITFYGTAQIDNAQYWRGGGSLLLDSNSDYVTLPTSTIYDLRTNDFTFEARIRLAALPGADTHYVIFDRYVDANNNWFLSLYGTSGGATPIMPHIFGHFSGVNMNHSATIPALAVDTWYHIAFVRTGDTMYFLLDGVRYSFSSAMTEDIVSLNAPLTIGAEGTTPAGRFFNGWIDEIRISPIARYTEDFTPQDSAYKSNDSGILINNTGIYGCGQGQTLANANFKVLATGNAYFKGEIQASTGQIGNVTITTESLIGGLIEGSVIRGVTIETSSAMPKTTIDDTGIYYQITTGAGAWGNFLWGDGTLYGTGTTAHLFKEDYPIFSVLSEQNEADIRLYNRSTDPAAGTHAIGDLICVNAVMKSCRTNGSPGTFKPVGNVLENLTADPASPVVGQIWIRTNI